MGCRKPKGTKRLKIESVRSHRLSKGLDAVKRCQFGFSVILVVCFSIEPIVLSLAEDNSLSDYERSSGWILLFDGATTKGWMSRTGQSLPATHVQNGSLNPHPCDYMIVHEK